MKKILACITFVLSLFSAAISIRAAEVYFVDLSEKQEVPASGSAATGSGSLTLNADNTVTYNVSYQGLQGNWTASHIHGATGPGTNAAVNFALSNTPNGPNAGTLTGTTAALTANQIANLRAGLFYVNIHSVSFPGGEIRGQVGPMSTFTYQGKLASGGAPANGPFDLTFALFDAPGGGTQIGNTLTNPAVTVSNGLFTVTLDFFTRPVFDSARWLQIGVRTNGAVLFAPLIPRQKLTAAPYATTAGTLSGALPAGQIAAGTAAINISGNAATATSATSATSASSFSGPLAGDVTGTQGATVVSTVSGQAADAVAAGGIAANAAASANTANTIVKRDASGSFSAGNITGTNFTGSGAGLTSITTSGLADGAVTSAKIADGAIVDADINAAAAIADTKLAPIATAGKVADSALSANVTKLGQTIESSEITDGEIVNADINAAAAIADTKLATIATAGKVADSALSANVSLLGQTIESAEITDGTIVDADINAAAAIADTKLATISTAGKVADTALSGNVALLDRSPQTFTGTNSFLGRVGIGTATPTANLHVVQAGQNAGANLNGFYTAAVRGEGANGVIGFTPALSGIGVLGYATNTSGYGVYGTASGTGGTGVYADGAGSSGTALAIAGGIRVVGAGLGTSTAAFIHRAVSTNTFVHFTTIYNPLTDNDPDAILIITHNWTADTNSVSKYLTNTVGVYYTGSRWAIFDERFAPILGRAFNVLVIKP